MSDLYLDVPIIRAEDHTPERVVRPRFASDQIWALVELPPDAYTRPPSAAFRALLRDPATYQLPSIVNFWRCTICREFTIAPSSELGYCSRCGTAK